VLVDASGRGVLYDCPNEDGQPIGLALCALDNAQSLAEESAEVAFGDGAFSVYFDAVFQAADPQTAAAALPRSSVVLRALPAAHVCSAPYKPPSRVPPTAAQPRQPPQPLAAAVRAAPPSLVTPAFPAVDVTPSLPGPAARFSASAQPPAAAPRLLSRAELLASFDEEEDDEPVPPPVPEAPPLQQQAYDQAAMPYKRMCLPKTHARVPALLPEEPAAPPAPPHAAMRPAAPSSRGRQQAQLSGPSMHASGVRFLFPGPHLLRADGAKQSERLCSISNTFPNAQSYARALIAAVAEELQLRLCYEDGGAQKFHAALQRAGLHADAPAAAMAAACRRAGLGYYARAELSAWVSDAEYGAGRGGGSSRRVREAEEDEDGSLAAKASDAAFTLHIQDCEKEASKSYSKGDLWVLSTWPSLSQAAEGGADGWTVVACSTYHAPNPNGALGLALLGPRPPGLGGSKRRVAVHALHCLNAAGEIDQLATLAMLLQPATASALPLLPALLGQQPSAPPQRVTTLDMCAVQLMDRFGLNEDQASVVQAAAGWTAPATARSSPPVLLVHGPFGCGKTKTLAAVVRNLCAALVQAKSGDRILLAGFTNASVDRLLSALVEGEFTDFIRVGSLRRIAPHLLPYALGCAGADKSRAKDSERDLRAALAEACSPVARAYITAELEGLSTGRTAARMRRLATCRVVATTTASCASAALAGQTFAYVLLDEASQLTEAQALLPLIKFKARHAILVGDPKQLPPMAVGRAAAVAAPRTGDIVRPLFVRLADAGTAPVLLRTQYRCHPALSAVPNAAFYGGRLVDGVSETQRPPLLPHLPHLLFLDVACGEAQAGPDRSRYHDAEAVVVARVVRMLLAAGVSRSDLGVCTFYLRQRDAVKRHLAQLAPAEGGGDEGELVVSTVDAFQGQEKEVILLSLCGPPRGFTTEERVNVALTRARSHLFVVGRATALRGEPWWDALLQSVRRVPTAYLPIRDTRAPLPAWDAPASAPAEDVAMEQEPADGEASVDPQPVAAADWNCAWGSAASWSSKSAAAVDEGEPEQSGPPLRAADERESETAEDAFAEAAFGTSELWTAYKAYQLYLYNNKKAEDRTAFLATTFGRILQRIYPAGRKRLLQRSFTNLYQKAELFVSRAHGDHATRLASLIAAHEDLPALRAACPAFASHLEQDAAEEDAIDAHLDHHLLSSAARGQPRRRSEVDEEEEQEQQQGGGAEPAISSEDYLF